MTLIPLLAQAYLVAATAALEGSGDLDRMQEAIDRAVEAADRAGGPVVTSSRSRGNAYASHSRAVISNRHGGRSIK